MQKPRVPTERITRERLRDWAKDLDSAHATPVLLIGISHDGERAGDLLLVTTNDMVTEDILAFLFWAIKGLGGEEILLEKIMARIDDTLSPGGLIIP